MAHEIKTTWLQESKNACKEAESSDDQAVRDNAPKRKRGRPVGTTKLAM